MAERQGFTPLIARTEAIDRCLPPVAFDCVRLCFLRTGTAILFSEFGTQPATPGDVILLAAHTLCGCEPEEWVSMTTLYLDTDFLIDQVFWQYASVLPDSSPLKISPMPHTRSRRSCYVLGRSAADISHRGWMS